MIRPELKETKTQPKLAGLSIDDCHDPKFDGHGNEAFRFRSCASKNCRDGAWYPWNAWGQCSRREAGDAVHKKTGDVDCHHWKFLDKTGMEFEK